MENLFAVPDDVLEWRASGSAPDGIPVFVFAPIFVAGVIIEQRVGNEFSDIEQALDPFVLGAIGEPMYRHELPKTIHLAVLDLEFIDHVVILTLSAQIGRGKLCIRALCKIIDAPIKAV